VTTVQHAIDTLEDLRRDWLSALHAELPDAIALRHRLHAQPRLSGDEEDTAATIEHALGIPMERLADTGRIGRVGPSEGPSVLLRAELDALPVTEATGAPYAATNGAMHACGHDVHQAALVAVVRACRTLSLPVGLVVLLQPREETYPSGARDAVQSGALIRYGVAAAAGAHVHPTVPAGTVATGAGVVNAAADEVEILVTGRGGHGAYPHRAADPIAAAAHIVLALPELVRRTVSPMRPATVSVGHVQSGQPSANVLPDQARILATMRTTDAQDRSDVQDQVRRLASSQAEAFGLASTVTITAGEPVLYNHPALVERMDDWLVRSGIDVTEPMRSLGADDFSFFGEVVPAVMSFVGVTVAGHDEAPELHHPRFLPDDDAILDVATTLVAAYLAGAEIIHLGLT
jgi:amidohydrolase